MAGHIVGLYLSAALLRYHAESRSERSDFLRGAHRMRRADGGACARISHYWRTASAQRRVMRQRAIFV